MKIVFLDESTISLENDMDYAHLEALGEFVCYPNSSEQETIERLGDAEIVVVNKVLMTRKVMQNLPGLKQINVIATGYNNIDIEATREAGVPVTNVSGYAVNTVPQHAFALILNLATQIHRYDRDVRAGFWAKSSSFTLLTYPTFELACKTIGIVGFGNIGKGVARIAEGFGMKVLAHDLFDFEHETVKNSPLEEVLTQSDIVSLHCPLTAENKSMIDKGMLGKMKSNALLINTARGPLVNQADLAEALNNGVIAGAGIDVLDEEPPKENPLLGEVKNLVLTPHSAWSAREARQKLVDEVALNIKAFTQGQDRNRVN